MDRVARWGSLTRAPGALKSHNAEKLKEGDPLRFCNIHSVAKHEKLKKQKILFSGKNLTMPKKTERGTLWDFSTSILPQNIKKMQGDGPFGVNFFFEKKSRSAEKNERGTLWSRPVWYVTRKNRKNLFGSVR